MTIDSRRATGWRPLVVAGLLLGILGPWPAARAAVSDGNPFYVRSDTWAETVLASRERYTRWWQAQLDGVWTNTKNVCRSFERPFGKATSGRSIGCNGSWP